MQKSDFVWKGEQQALGAKDFSLTRGGDVRLNGAKRAVMEWAAIQEFEKVLDLNVDNADLPQYLLTHYRLKVCGICESMEAAKDLRMRLSDADILPARPGDIPWHDGTFDVVLSAAPVSDYQNFEQVAREVKRVLRRGGQFVLSVPYTMEENLRPRSVMRILLEAGFQNVSWRAYRLKGVCIAFKDPELI